jgi:O-methyltransferase
MTHDSFTGRTVMSPVNTGAAKVDSATYAPHRSLPVRVVRGLLAYARVTAPKWLYEFFCRTGFTVWKSALRVVYGRKLLWAFVCSGSDLEMFSTVYRAMKFSLVGSSGLEATYKAVSDILRDRIGGALVECGVAEGGCSALMAKVAARYSEARTTWLFDSFEGLPDPTDKDFIEPNSGTTGENVRPLERGSCLGTYGRVQDVLFRRFGLDRNKITLVKGWFQDTLPAYKNRIGPIAMLRIDGDWYESTRCCLENLFDQVAPGGYCIIDDYGTFHGCRLATDEFIQARGLNIQARSDGRGGFLFRKPWDS